LEGKPIDMVSDEELYKDPAVVRQLLELSEVAVSILKEARKEKKLQPDFRRAPGGRDIKATIGGWISNPRYSKNILISDAPDEKGQRVFFVDTGINASERTVKSQEMLTRYVVNPLEQFHFNRWKKKLEGILKQESPKENI